MGRGEPPAAASPVASCRLRRTSLPAGRTFPPHRLSTGACRRSSPCAPPLRRSRCGSGGRVRARALPGAHLSGEEIRAKKKRSSEPAGRHTAAAVHPRPRPLPAARCAPHARRAAMAHNNPSHVMPSELIDKCVRALALTGRPRSRVHAAARPHTGLVCLVAGWVVVAAAFAAVALSQRPLLSSARGRGEWGLVV